MKKHLRSRIEVEELVHTFYSTVRKDELIGPIFNRAITDWGSHLKLLCDFWETNLLFVARYKGNPIKAHLELDNKEQNSLDTVHFDRWIELWIETVDGSFKGRNAELAKQRAHKIAGRLMNMITISRIRSSSIYTKKPNEPK